MRIRILWLILLTMAVTALPVSARSAAAKVKENEKALAASSESGSKDEQQDPAKKDEQPKIRPALNVDLWDGGSARTLAGSAGLLSISAILNNDAGVRLAPIESWPHAPNIMRAWPEREPRCWLTCRYAHAPPPID